ncbi:hypothetical protein OROMI_033460 [Orobanche minor]
MASANLSFCIFFVLGFALVGRMVQVVDATRELNGGPLETVKPKLLSTCAIRLPHNGPSRCDHGMDSEKSCAQACTDAVGAITYMAASCEYDGVPECLCIYIC